MNESVRKKMRIGAGIAVAWWCVSSSAAFAAATLTLGGAKDGLAAEVTADERATQPPREGDGAGHRRPPRDENQPRPQPPKDENKPRPQPPKDGDRPRPQPPKEGDKPRPRPPKDEDKPKPQPPKGGETPRPKPPNEGERPRPRPPQGGDNPRPQPPQDGGKPRPQPPKGGEHRPPYYWHDRHGWVETNRPIGALRAQEIAFSHAGVREVDVVESRVRFDRSLKIYRVDFESGSKAYRYEIDARDGRVLKQRVRDA